MTEDLGRLYLSFAVTNITHLLRSIIIARILGVEDFGIYASIVAFVALINGLAVFRTWDTSVRYIKDFSTRNEKDKALAVLKLCYIINVLTGILAFFIVFLLINLLRFDPHIYDYYLVYGLSLLLLTANSTSEGIITATERFTALSYIRIAISIIDILLTTVALTIYANLNGLFLAILLSNAIGSLVLNLYAYKISSQFFGPGWWRAKIAILGDRQREIIRFAFNITVNTFLKVIVTNVDILLVSILRGYKDVGVYKIAKTITLVLQSVATPFNEILYPRFSAIVSKGNIKELKQIVMRYAVIIPLPVLVSLGIFAFFSADIINFIYGNEYRPAAWAVNIMLIGAFFTLSLFWLRPLLFSFYDTVTTNIGFAVFVLLWLTIGPLLVSHYSYSGAAFVFSSGFFISTVISFARLQLHFKRLA